MRARSVPLGSVLLLAGAVALAGCREEVAVQTAIILEVRSAVAVECLTVTVHPAAGGAFAADVSVPGWDPDEAVRIAVYPGGALTGTLVAEATGRVRGPGGETCQGIEVAASEPLEVTFVSQQVVTQALHLEGFAPDEDGDGWIATVDCDDGDAGVYPGAGEICGDGIDQGCAGAPDYHCPCDDAPRPCHPLGLDHPSLTDPDATCRPGLQPCSGVWGPCLDPILPGPEDCDGLDTDCDGTPDPDWCPCEDGRRYPCWTGPPGAADVGECRSGGRLCTAGSLGPCEDEVLPGPELCNRLDDDCDGATDEPEDLVRTACPLTLGVCVRASLPCDGGVLGACSEEVYAAASNGTYEPVETACDFRDNDCDGTIDEDCSCNPLETGQQVCYPYGEGPQDPTANVGACRVGRAVCLAEGTWAPCDGAITPVDETCNGVDDDCDGITDDVSWVGEACAAEALGACSAGRLICVPGQPAGGRVCRAGEPISPDPVCDGLDADCDALGGNDDRDAPCPDGGLCCGALCRDVRRDPRHCGDCDVACPTDVGECRAVACLGGACGYEAFPNGQPCTADGKACTQDVCESGLCRHRAVGDGTPCDDSDGVVCQGVDCVLACFIRAENRFVAPGTLRPASPCEACRPPRDPFGWSAVDDATPCPDDANPCTRDLCRSGVCAHENLGDGSACGSGRVCSAAQCQEGCFIAGTFHPKDALDPANPCRACKPAVSTAAWTNLPSTAPCSDALWCTVSDHCDGSGRCGGAPRDCSAVEGPCATSRCDEPTDSCEAVERTVGTACTLTGSAGVCDAGGTCTLACFIDGALVQAGSTAPGNVCRECDPFRSTTAWVAVTDTGRTCSDGDTCTLDDHCDGAGSCVGGTTLDCSPLAGPCTTAACDPVAQACQTSYLAGGASCEPTDPSQICDGAGTCAAGCWLGGEFVPAFTERPGNECRACVPSADTTAWTRDPDGTPCGTDDGNPCTTSQCLSGTCSTDNLSGTSCGAGCTCDAGTRTETACGDNTDNDGDGARDCADPDCLGSSCHASGRTCQVDGSCT